jgi:hypothetical protein
VIVILALTMTFTVILLTMKVSPVAAVGMLAAASGWTIRLARLGRLATAIRPRVAG